MPFAMTKRPTWLLTAEIPEDFACDSKVPLAIAVAMLWCIEDSSGGHWKPLELAEGLRSCGPSAHGKDFACGLGASNWQVTLV